MAADPALGRLWGALSGRLEAADDVRTVNAALREDFSCFELHHGDDGGFGIVPRLNPEAAVRFDEGRLHLPVDNSQRLRSRPAADTSAVLVWTPPTSPWRDSARASGPGCDASR